MYKGKKTLGIITARGGSKSIPRKNIKLLGGKPLIAYTIETAKGSKYLTRCVVSTDDEEIASISREYGADVPFMRPKELARDESTSMEVVQHALAKLEDDFGEAYDYLMILQPTSPFRKPEDIDESIIIAVDADADSVMSMVQVADFSLKKTKKIQNGSILPFLESEKEWGDSARRQDEEIAYKRNCAIYLTRASLIARGELFGEVSRAYVMPESRSLDINEPFHFELAEFLMNRLHGS